ncbi:MAG: sodium/solute symporter [Kiritimatiellia bacterium]
MEKEENSLISWSQLTEIPDSIGLGGAFVGLHNNALIIAGGTNFPEGPPWKNGPKAWHKSIYVLEQENDKTVWHTASDLEKPLAYGVSISTDQGLICIGGCNDGRYSVDVFILQWDSTAKKIIRKNLPSLPQPLAYAAGALVEDTIYVAGGKNAVDASPGNDFLSLDLSKISVGPVPHRALGAPGEGTRPTKTGSAVATKELSGNTQWQTLSSFPGKKRINPLAAAQSDGFGEHFYIFGGMGESRDENGETEKVYLRDAWRYSPVKDAWKKLKSLPRPVRSSTCLAIGQSQILIFGGPDGTQPEQNRLEDHPGFPTDILAYHTITDTWTERGEIPVSPAVTSAVMWNGKIVIPTGEIRPAVRTPKVWQGSIQSSKRGFGLLNYTVLATYLILLVGMGFYFSCREKTTADFFLAGQRIPWWAAALSIYGTQLSAITFMATPARCFSSDWLYFLPSRAILFMAAPLAAFIFIPFFRRLNVNTAYEYLERRFNSYVRKLASAAFILFQVARMGVVVFLPSIALSTVTGMNIHFCILAMGVFCIIYTTLGGIEAVIWSDVIQVVVLLGGALVCFIAIANGLDGGVSEIISTGIADSKFRIADMDPAWSLSTPSLLVIMLGGFAYTIPYTSDQTVIQRYLTVKDEKAAKRSVWANGLISIPGALLFYLLGTALYVFYKSHPIKLDPAMANDSIVPWFIMNQLPDGVSGLIIAGIFAAAMSSLDSSMNSTATAVINDFMKPMRKQQTEHHWLQWARWLTAMTGVLGTAVALVMASSEIKSLMDQFTRILGLFGGGLAGLFILGAFSRRAHGTGALLAALVTTAILFYVQTYTSLHFFVYGAVGLFSCYILGVVFSLLIPAAPPNIEGLTVYSLFRKK